jgi:hypothetical protein
MELEYSYSLQKIITYLNKRNIVYTINNPGFSMCLVMTGIRIAFPDGVHYLSIQTHPIIAGTAFAETLLHTLTDEKIGLVYNKQLMYYRDMRKYNEPEELFEHIDECLLHLV